MTVKCDDIGAGGTEIKTKVPRVVLDNPEAWKFTWLDNKPAWHNPKTDEWVFPDDTAVSRPVAVPAQAGSKGPSGPSVEPGDAGYAYVGAPAVYHPTRTATAIPMPKAAELPVPRKQAAAPVPVAQRAVAPATSQWSTGAKVGAVVGVVTVCVLAWWLVKD